MLHEDPWMVDIDVNHWRNLQALVLVSAKEKRRIVVIHEQGVIQKFVHSQRLEIVRNVDRVDDPHAVAEQIYRENADKVDFVAVFERRAFDRYMAHWQDTWRPDEDLDIFVHRTYATMDDYGDAIVTYPGPARGTLGLQWRLGASYEVIRAAVERFVPANTTVVLGIFDGDELWATLVLGFDSDRRAKVVTTVDMSELEASGLRDRVTQAVIDWVDRKYGPCSLALFTDVEGARVFLSAGDKVAALRKIAASQYLRVARVPPALAGSIPATA
jgi:hypothetical protein